MCMFKIKAYASGGKGLNKTYRKENGGTTPSGNPITVESRLPKGKGAKQVTNSRTRGKQATNGR